MVAPYEADAQLAYLSTLSPENGGIVAVISEDSDLLAYGCDVVKEITYRYFVHILPITWDSNGVILIFCMQRFIYVL